MIGVIAVPVTSLPMPSFDATAPIAAHCDG